MARRLLGLQARRIASFSIDPGLLEDVEELAARARISRSEFVNLALAAEVGRLNSDGDGRDVEVVRTGKRVAPNPHHIPRPVREVEPRLKGTL